MSDKSGSTTLKISSHFLGSLRDQWQPVCLCPVSGAQKPGNSNVIPVYIQVEWVYC